MEKLLFAIGFGFIVWSVVVTLFPFLQGRRASKAQTRRLYWRMGALGFLGLLFVGLGGITVSHPLRSLPQWIAAILLVGACSAGLAGLVFGVGFYAYRNSLSAWLDQPEEEEMNR